ncbi:hypothetical protein ACLKA6_005858 [Drosophila palustris]
MIFILILMLSFVYAQDIDGCAGSPSDPDCDGSKDPGHADEEGCDLNANELMWYYSGSSCHKMFYLGCGGNRNRYCTEFLCQLLCERVYNKDSLQW